MRAFIAVALLAILLSGCTAVPPKLANNSKSPEMSSPNASNKSNPASQPPANPALPPDYSISLGDHVWVNYTLTVDGKVIDTTNATLANESGILNPKRRYAPFEFDVQINKGVIEGFVVGVIGMKVNETATIVVDPKHGYGLYDPAKIVVVPRYYNKSVLEVIPRSYFTDRNITFSNGTSFDTPYGIVSIQDYNDENVTISYIALTQVNSSFIYNGVPQRVVAFSNYTATIENMLETNATYGLPDPKTGTPKLLKVIGKNDENITLDANPPLVNKTLVFRTTVLKIQHGNQTLGSAG
ncbi:MAG: FKBP-type peptidyl-prolyl cis-trans isomerase [Candidatus Micrarchaeia archaeon]